MSKQRKLRSKLSFDAEEADAADAPPPPPPSATSKKDSSSSKPKKSTLLSFGDDEEPLTAGSSKPKKNKDKSSSTARVSKFHRGSAVPPAAASQAAADASAAHKPSAGEYTAEKLAALQAATAKLPSKYKQAAAAGAAAAEDGSFKLSGSFKSLKKPHDDRFTYNYSIHGTVSTADEAAAGAANGTAAGGSGGLRPPGQQQQQQQSEQEHMPLPPPPKRPGAAAAAAAAAADGGGDDSEGDEDGPNFAMPDEDTIRIAKAKRERLRQAHLAPDYLPLGGTSKFLGTTAGGGGGSDAIAAAGGPYGGSDSEGDEDNPAGPGQGLRPPGQQGLGGSDSETELEERMRLTFVGHQQQQQQQQRGRGGSSSSKGGSSRAAAAAAMASGHYAATVQDDDEDEEMQENDGVTQQQQRLAAAIKRNAAGGSSRLAGTAAAGGGARGEAAIAAAAAAVLESLQEAAGRATARHKQLSANLKRTNDNLVNALEEAERVKADIASTGVKYAAVQAFKAYLADLADCLAAKGPLVEELGDTLQQLRVDAAEALRQQQQDDETILYAQAEAAVTAALAVLGNGGAAPAAAAAAQSAAADAEAAAVAAAAAAGGSSSVDEFGRDLGLMRRQELQRGAGRRQARVEGVMAQIEAMQQGGVLDLEADPTGSSSSGSSTAAAAEADAVQQYKRRRLEVLDLAPTVFADADEQYASLTAVKAKLEGFKAQYPREYSQAYVGESAAALFAPYVRLELLQWEPLPIGSSSSSSSSSPQQQPAANGSSGGAQQQPAAVVPFDTQQWYQQLFEFGLGGAADGGGAAAVGVGDDADANLVPQLVESLLLPLALTLVAKCWDPCDLVQTRAVVGLVSDLFVYVPADKEDMAQLLALTTGSLAAAATAAATTVPPWPSAAAATSPLAQAMLQLRFRRAAALLRGLVGFQELLNQGLLFKLALGGLVGQQLVPCLRSSMSDLGLAVARAEAVVLSLPAAWFQQQAPPREAQSLLEVVASLGRSVEQQQQRQAGAGGAAAAAAAAAAGSVSGYGRRVAALLAHLGLKEQGQRLQGTF